MYETLTERRYKGAWDSNCSVFNKYGDEREEERGGGERKANKGDEGKDKALRQALISVILFLFSSSTTPTHTHTTFYSIAISSPVWYWIITFRGMTVMLSKLKAVAPPEMTSLSCKWKQDFHQKWLTTVVILEHYRLQRLAFHPSVKSSLEAPRRDVRTFIHTLW